MKSSLIFLSHWFEMQLILDFAFPKSVVFYIFREKNNSWNFTILESYTPYNRMSL